MTPGQSSKVLFIKIDLSYEKYHENTKEYQTPKAIEPPMRINIENHVLRMHLKGAQKFDNKCFRISFPPRQPYMTRSLL